MSELSRDELMDVVYGALREWDRAERLARELRMIRPDGPRVKRGTGKGARALHVVEAIRKAQREADR